MLQCPECRWYLPKHSPQCRSGVNNVTMMPTGETVAPLCTECGRSLPNHLQKCSHSSLTAQPERVNNATMLLAPPVNVKQRTVRLPIPGLTGLLPVRDSKTGRWGCLLGCLVSAILTVLLVSIFLLFRQPPPPPTITIRGNVVPKSLLNIHGNNFPQGSIVEITMGDVPSAFTSPPLQNANATTTVLSMVMHSQQIHSSGDTFIVRNDGTFDTTVVVPENWIAGSRHIIQAQAKNGAATEAHVIVIVPPPLTGLPPSKPVVSSIEPKQGLATGGTTVVIKGENLTGASAVSFGNTAASSYKVDSDGQITAVSPAGSKGTVHVRVTTKAGTSEGSTGDEYSYVPPPKPVVSSIEPNNGPTTGKTRVLIKGENLTGAREVWFGGNASNFQVNQDGTITAISPAGEGTVDVTVKTEADELSDKSEADVFTYFVRPGIRAISSGTGSTGERTRVVVIEEQNLTGATEVAFRRRATSF